MIHFECEHCGRPVRVPQACAGKNGRCPSCGRIVRIPGTSLAPEEEGTGEAMSDLTAAVTGDQKDQTVPPPPTVHEADPGKSIEEEFDIPMPTGNAADETEILPAEVDLEDDAEQVSVRSGEEARALHPPVAAVKIAARSADSGKRLTLILFLIVVVLGIAIAAVFLVSAYWSHCPKR